MAETIVDNGWCAACGADIRSGALFCYNCGGSVAPAENAAAGKRKARKGKAPAATRVADVDEPVRNTQPLAEIPLETASSPAKKELGIAQEAKLRTAANLRRKGKSFQRRTVEIEWEPPTENPGAMFVIVGVLMIVFVVLVFLLAMYLK